MTKSYQKERMLASALRRTVLQPQFKRSIGKSVLSISQRSLATKFAPSHEYIKVDSGVGTVGITDFAQKALGDVVYVDLPGVGDTFDKGDSFGSVESVKAASDVYVPVSGEIIEINEELTDDTSLVNSSPEDKAWFVKVKISDEGELGDLLDDAAYKAHCDSSD